MALSEECCRSVGVHDRWHGRWLGCGGYQVVDGGLVGHGLRLRT